MGNAHLIENQLIKKVDPKDSDTYSYGQNDQI